MTETSDIKTQASAVGEIDNGPPAWVTSATTSATAFWHGTRRGVESPGLILTLTSIGFGALAHAAGVSLFQTLAMMVVFFALPAQVVLVDQISRGASVLAASFAVALTGVRLLPMAVTLIPYFSDRRTRAWQTALAAHFVAVTAWLEGMRWVPTLPQHLRMAYFIGIGVSLVLATMLGTAIGHLIAGVMPTPIARVLPFLSPIYFLVSMLAAARTRGDHFPIIAGLIIGPLTYLIAPELDLLLAGLVGGTIAHFAAKRAR
ncbi:MAG: AzlC family ABC transporter permease [Hyphomicrobiaceae bacterium]